MLLTTLVMFLAWADSPEVKNVSNGRSPVKDRTVLVLTEDLRLGPENGEDHFLWSGPNVAVEANPAGHMFVVDDNSNRIIELDRDGHFVRQIGRTGEGPGEFQGLRSLRILEDGSAIAFENLQNSGIFTYYRADFSVREKLNLAKRNINLSSAAVSRDGRWLLCSNSKTDPKTTKQRNADFIMSNEFKPVHEVVVYHKDAFDRSRVGDPAYWQEILAQAISVFARGQSGYAAFDPDGRVYTAVASRYEVTGWNPEMQKSLVFSRDYRPIPLTDEEVSSIVDPIFAAVISQLPAQLQSIITPNLVKGAVEMADFPPVKNPIGGLNVTQTGLILVIHDQSNLTGKETADIFNRDGVFQGSYSHPNSGLGRMVFKNGFAYTIETVEEENYMVRYKVSGLK